MQNPIKVWSEVCEYYGPSINNVNAKFKEWAPDTIEFVDDWIGADVAFDHIIGAPNRKELVSPLEEGFSNEVIARLELPIVKNAYFFYCNIPEDSEFHKEAMGRSLVTASYLDIPKYLFPNDGKTQMTWRSEFLRIPLGVDPSDFLLPIGAHKKEYLIYAWGCSSDPEDEYIESIYKACKAVGGKLLHSGFNYNFDDGKHYVYVSPAKTKAEVAERYSKCYFANAMRKEDGFELANVEAPLANCQPITLEKQPYIYFFACHNGRHSTFVNERENMVAQLIEIFKEKERICHITTKDKRFILEKFNWRDPVTGFWDELIKQYKEETIS